MSRLNYLFELAIGSACMDPESFVRGGPSLTFSFKLIRGGRVQISTTRGPSSAASETPFKWCLAGVLMMPNIECWLDSFVIFQGIRTNITNKKHYIFVIFQGGGGVRTPCLPPPSGSMHDQKKVSRLS